MKISLEDYKTEKFNIEIDGVKGEVEVHSLASREWKEAASKFASAIQYAKENKIDLEITEVIDLGFEHDGKQVINEVKSRSEFAIKAHNKSVSCLVKLWPFEIDLLEALGESPALVDKIDIIASSLKRDFDAKKKS